MTPVNLKTIWSRRQLGVNNSSVNLLPNKVTSSAGAEISDGPHKGALRRAGPNDFMFVYKSMQRDLSISILFVFVFCFVNHVFYFLQIE